MNYVYFIEAFQTEQDLALSFSAQNKNYKFSNTHFYEYNNDKTLWEIITVDDIISSMSIWIIHNIGRFIMEEPNTKDLIDKLNFFQTMGFEPLISVGRRQPLCQSCH